MKHPLKTKSSGNFLRQSTLPAATLTLVALCVSGLCGSSAHASIAYGSINNFDTVNDTGVPAHGFEIELDDIRSTDITYTYDWNHYGTPTIREDSTSVPGHTNVFVRYAAVTNAAGFVLEQSSNLSTTSWITATNSVSVTGPNNQVVVSTTNGSLFFRLRYP